MRVLSLLVLCGCGLGRRLVHTAVPSAYVTAPPAQELASVHIDGADGPRPLSVEVRPDGLVSPVRISDADTLSITPSGEPVALRLFIRGTLPGGEDFTPVISVTGAREDDLVDEIRFLPPTIAAPYRLPIQDLANVYNHYVFRDDHLLLVEVSDGVAVERYLFLSRVPGWHTATAFDVLVRTPIGADGVELSPALTGGLVLGYRLKDADRRAARLLDPLGVQLSLGIGSAALASVQDEDELTDGVSLALYSALGGGGLRLWDMVSVQALVNLRGLTNPDVQPEVALAAGFDAVKLAVATRDIATQLLRPNPLSVPPRERSTPGMPE